MWQFWNKLRHSREKPGIFEFSTEKQEIWKKIDIQISKKLNFKNRWNLACISWTSAEIEFSKEKTVQHQSHLSFILNWIKEQCWYLFIGLKDHLIQLPMRQLSPSIKISRGRWSKAVTLTLNPYILPVDNIMHPLFENTKNVDIKHFYYA